MAYTCPRCRGRATRFREDTGVPAQLTGNPGGRRRSPSRYESGLVMVLLNASFGPLECRCCGPISRREFTFRDRLRMEIVTAVLVATALLVTVGVLWVSLHRDYVAHTITAWTGKG